MRKKTIANVITTAIFLTILVIVTLAVKATAQDPDGTGPIYEVKRRLAWQIGHASEQMILTITNPQEVSLGSATVLSEGIEITIEGGEVFMSWSPTIDQAGLENQVIQIHNMTSPPFPNWTGELLVTTETVTIQTWAYPQEYNPFLVGGPDILVAPTL